MTTLRKYILSILLFIIFVGAQVDGYTIEQLHGIWWAPEPAPTAAFAIEGNEVWFDYDSQYHPARLEYDLLIVDHGSGLGVVRSRITSLGDDHLELQEVNDLSSRRRYTRSEPRH